jgi:hypothetical protein
MDIYKVIEPPVPEMEQAAFLFFQKILKKGCPFGLSQSEQVRGPLLPRWEMPFRIP